MSYFVYMVRCADQSLYTGFARDPVERTKVHNAGKGSFYVRTRLPAELVYVEGPFAGKGEALRREYQIKQLTRLRKLELVRDYQSRKLSDG